MSRTRGTFADKLDTWLETATGDELWAAAIAINVWARQRKLGFIVKVERVKVEAKPEENNGSN